MTMLSKFSGDGDAYLFLSEYEVSMFCEAIPECTPKISSLHFIPFALKKLVKKNRCIAS